MKKTFLIVFIAWIAFSAHAQAGDTIIVELAKTSRVVFTIKDRSDLEILKHYDFNELFQDMLVKLEKSDTTALAKNDSSKVDVAENNDDETWHHDSDNGDDDDD